MTQVW